MSPRVGRWLTITEAAELTDVPERTMRRRLHFLNEQSGGTLLRQVGKKRLMVSAEALQRELGSPPESSDEVAALRFLVELQDRKLTALRDELRALRRQVREAGQRWSVAPAEGRAA